MPDETDRTLLERLYAIVRWVLLVGVFGYLAWDIATGWETIRALNTDWRIGWLAAAFFTALLAYQGLFFAWILLLRRTGHYRAGQWRAYAHAWWGAFMYRYVPGKVMLLVERARLGSRLGIPPAAGGMITIIEFMLSVLAGATVALLAVFYFADIDQRLMVVIIVVAAGTIFLFPPIYRLLSRLPSVKQRYPELESLALRPIDIVVIALPCLGYYLLLGLSLYLLAQNLTPLDWALLPGLIGIYALSHVIGLLAVLAPAGLGVREGTLTVLLTPLLSGGVAGLMAVIVRLWFTMIEIVSYGLFVATWRSPR